MDDLRYDPTSWFWLLLETGEIYSSAERTFMPANDIRVEDFKAQGGAVTRIASLASLKEVLAAQAPDHMPVDLVAYAAQKRWELEVSGIRVEGVPVATSRESQAMIHGAFSMAQAGLVYEFQFKSEVGFMTLPAVAVVEIGKAVARHVQECFAWEARVLQDIEDGTVTSETDIAERAEAFYDI